jgi:hypothetical protein
VKMPGGVVRIGGCQRLTRGPELLMRLVAAIETQRKIEMSGAARAYNGCRCWAMPRWRRSGST